MSGEKVEVEYKFRIKDIPKDERPRERLIKYGPKHLSTAELLAIIMRVGTREKNAVDLAKELLENYNLPALAKSHVTGLKKILGISNAKACQVIACFELGRRLLTYESKPPIKTAQDIADLFMPELQYLKKENLKGVYLDGKNRMIWDETISIGSLNANIVHPREVFKVALEKSAASVILVHNHPSGDSTPSSDDIELTKRLIEAGKLMDIEVLDHIIIGDGEYISLKERELI
jgi:DNA repair protein RadC